MWKWKKQNQNQIEKQLIFRAFPISLKEDVEKVIEILPLDHNILYRFGQIVHVNYLIHPDTQTVILESEKLGIPSRIYFNEPVADKESQLTELQKIILNCLYLRHHNGLIRQERLSHLLNKNDYFIIPYKFHLLGEYVVEILEELNKHITNDYISQYVKFANENEKYFIRTESRMASFWNAHYRWKSLKLKNYIGRQIIEKIKSERTT